MNPLDEVKRDIQQINETGWGPWKLDRTTGSVYVEKPYEYSLRINDLRSKDGLVDTLSHVAEKTWADNECLGGLVRAALSIWQATADPLLHK